MLRLDHNRALSQIAAKTGKPVASHREARASGATTRPTMYADYRFATIDGQSVKDMINDQAWNKDVFLPTVGKRGAAIIEARGLSSAASAANAAIDHMRDWALGTKGEWVTMGMPIATASTASRRTSCSASRSPATAASTRSSKGCRSTPSARSCIDKTLAELTGEQDGVKHLL